MNTSTPLSALVRYGYWAAGVGLAVTMAAMIWIALTAPRPAPPVTFTSITGERIPLASLRGRPVLISFWATSCAICVREVPKLRAIHDGYGTPGLTVIAVAMPYDPPSEVIAFAQTRDLPYVVSLDVQGEITRAFGDIRGVPTKILISPTGEVLWRLMGPVDPGLLDNAIRGALANS